VRNIYSIVLLTCYSRILTCAKDIFKILYAKAEAPEAANTDTPVRFRTPAEIRRTNRQSQHMAQDETDTILHVNHTSADEQEEEDDEKSRRRKLLSILAFIKAEFTDTRAQPNTVTDLKHESKVWN
jgi:hypothetical protein